MGNSKHTRVFKKAAYLKKEKLSPQALKIIGWHNFLESKIFMLKIIKKHKKQKTRFYKI